MKWMQDNYLSSSSSVELIIQVPESDATLLIFLLRHLLFHQHENQSQPLPDICN